MHSGGHALLSPQRNNQRLIGPFIAVLRTSARIAAAGYAFGAVRHAP
jgi:hypothetical protein